MNSLARKPGVPELLTDPEALVDAVIARAGKQIRLGLPLGLGKANTLANALCARALADPSLSLTIYTALTLEAPIAASDLAHRFLKPLEERFFSGYPRLAYARMLKEKNLPDNICVHEFFLQPGHWLGNKIAQQNYVSLNYTHVLPFLVKVGINVVGQLVAPSLDSPTNIATRYSLSCNPDITADLIDLRRAGKLDCLIVGEVNKNLPFMYGAADRVAEDFDFILDSGRKSFALFMPPPQAVEHTDHAIGIHAASLVEDGGTLQIGIGSMGDAVAHALILRHQQPDIFRASLHRLSPAQNQTGIDHDSFSQGLYGLSEMLTEGFLKMLEAGVIKRSVDDYFIHAGFFMGSPLLYRTLIAMSEETRRKIGMMPVSFVNELYGDENKKRGARHKARFINSGIMATLTGEIISDGLENGQVISGVGGQYNFIAQAFALADARSMITLRATRQHKGKLDSNIRWSYGHITIPRHLRDIVITEYGIADLRGKSDAQVIAAMLNIADSRFQPRLLEDAKAAGKIAQDYEIPSLWRNNLPERISAVFSTATAGRNLFSAFPLGSDFSPEEQRLIPALKQLNDKADSIWKMMNLFRQGWRHPPDKAMQHCLQRMKLNSPTTIKEFFLRQLLIGALVRENSSPPSL